MSDQIDVPSAAEEQDDDLLTRAEASAYLARFHVHLKPATLARMWSVGSPGPPCRHIRRKPMYPRRHLREWALSQTSGLRRSRKETATISRLPKESQP